MYIKKKMFSIISTDSLAAVWLYIIRMQCPLKDLVLFMVKVMLILKLYLNVCQSCILITHFFAWCVDVLLLITKQSASKVGIYADSNTYSI